jgi:hypothetical protein
MIRGIIGLLALVLAATAQAGEDNHARTGDVFNRGLARRSS